MTTFLESNPGRPVLIFLVFLGWFAVTTNAQTDLSCWNVNCSDITCGPTFNESLASTDPSNFVQTVPINSGKCVITEQGAARIYSVDTVGPNCINYCLRTGQNRPGNNDAICDLYRSTYCCNDQDFCLSPKVERDNASCYSIFSNFGNLFLASLVENCTDVAQNPEPENDESQNEELTEFDSPLNPISYTTLTSESGYLTFSVNENVTGFDYVNLFINEGTRPYVCMANGTFHGNQTYRCIIPGLNTDKIYSITLQGHDPNQDNGTVDGFTEMSAVFSIYQGGTFNLTCGSDGYEIEFYFGDLTSSKVSVMLTTQTTPQTFETGTVFDELVTIQSSWYGEMVFVPPANIFKGFPNAIVVQNESDPIVILTSLYDFIDTPTYNGDPGAYDETLSETFNLTDKRVVSVSGSFSNGVLTSIQFEAVDANGDKVESKCYGGGNCSEFTLNQTDSNQYFVGFAGKTNEDGRIVELRTHWASVSPGMYYVGVEDCMVETEPNWHDISKFKYSYSVKSYDACGTVHSVADAGGSHTVVYDNTVSRQTDNVTSGVDTVREVSMKVSRHMPGAGANIKCTYQADGDVTALFNTGKEETSLNVVDINSVRFEMNFYTDNSFTSSVSSQDVLSVVSGERLYFGVSFKNKTEVGMTLYAHMCFAKKDNNAEFSDLSEIYVLEEDGCPKEDDSFMRMESVRSSASEMMDPLSIQAFYWLDDSNMVVYLHCKVRACPSEDRGNCTAPTTCDQGNRKRREIMLDMPDSPRESFVSSQPIIIQKEAIFLAPGGTLSVGKQMWLPMSVFCGIMAAFLVIILNAFRKLKLKNLFNYQRMKSY